jgi:hypothetical protein
MRGTVVVSQRWHPHPLSLLPQQRDSSDALGEDALDLMHAQSVTQSRIALQIWVLSSVRKLAKIIGENVNQGHRSKN